MSYPRAVNKDGLVYRGVIQFKNILTGEDRFLYSGGYARPGAATAWKNRMGKRKTFYARGQTVAHRDDVTGAYTWSSPYKTVPEEELFPIWDKWTEVSKEWERL